MTVRVTRQLTGVDGKTCLDGKESNTERLTRTIKMRLTKVITLKVSILGQISVPSVSPPNDGSVKSVTPIICTFQNCKSWKQQNNVEVVRDITNLAEHLSNYWMLFPLTLWDLNDVSHSHLFQRILYAYLRFFCCCLECLRQVTTRFIFPISVSATCHFHIFHGVVANLPFASGWRPNTVAFSSNTKSPPLWSKMLRWCLGFTFITTVLKFYLAA